MAHFSHSFNSINSALLAVNYYSPLMVSVFQHTNSIHTSFPVTWHED